MHGESEMLAMDRRTVSGGRAFPWSLIRLIVEYAYGVTLKESLRTDDLIVSVEWGSKFCQHNRVNTRATSSLYTPVIVTSSIPFPISDAPKNTEKASPSSRTRRAQGRRSEPAP